MPPYESSLRPPRSVVELYVSQITALHDAIILATGGLGGVRDQGGIVHYVYEFLKTFEPTGDRAAEMGAFIYAGIARHHYFFDGNKRTAFAHAKIMLFLVGCHLKVNYREALPFLFRVADHTQHVPQQEIIDWFQGRIERYAVPEGEDGNAFISEKLQQLLREMKE